MSKKSKIVITTYGHERKIDRISVNIFDENYFGEVKNESAETYCASINSIELKSDAWIHAKIVSINIPYFQHNFIPFNFSDLILKLDDIAIQCIIGEIDNKVLINAIKTENEDVKTKIYRNMSKNASETFKEDLKFKKAISITVVKEAQEKIISFVCYMIDCGVIISPYIADEELIKPVNDKWI